MWTAASLYALCIGHCHGATDSPACVRAQYRPDRSLSSLYAGLLLVQVLGSNMPPIEDNQVHRCLEHQTISNSVHTQHRDCISDGILNNLTL